MLYSEYYKTKNNVINHDFIRWINTVESLVYKRFNMNLLDLPDEAYMDFFESKLTPNEVFQIIKENNGF